MALMPPALLRGRDRFDLLFPDPKDPDAWESFPCVEIYFSGEYNRHPHNGIDTNTLKLRAVSGVKANGVNAFDIVYRNPERALLRIDRADLVAEYTLDLSGVYMTPMIRGFDATDSDNDVLLDELTLVIRGLGFYCGSKVLSNDVNDAGE